VLDFVMSSLELPDNLKQTTLLRDVESRSRALVEDLGTPVTVGPLRMQSAAEGEAKGPRPPADTRLTSPVTPP
jgi:hypothetical protein